MQATLASYSFNYFAGETAYNILFPRKPVEPVMRMLLPLKYAMILAASMLSYSYIIDHVRLILCFRELEREERG